MPRRRHFLHVAATQVGGALVYTLSGEAFRAVAQDPKASLRIRLRFFSEQQALIIAAAARIFPTDAAGPGAREANVIVYIDRQFAGAYGRDRFRYTRPPFVAGKPEQGYQGKETPREIYLDGLQKLGPDFGALSPEAQDRKLEAIERTRFFQMLRRHVIEGMFCDPMHGGNADLIGWQLVGFPGPYMSWASEFDQHDGVAFHPKPKSLAQIIGHPVKPWDGES
ncbi:MAG: gluconate 2-dehydrogenase subunit 3 family protein [Acidobacteria bacterium]|nr:gluconate 2-dehydrogenase subunit 3 family protein [Acidobacteriota bacterium]